MGVWVAYKNFQAIQKIPDFQRGYEQMKDVTISQKQAQQFARAIFPDIAAYIQAHQEEFQEFLRKEMQEDKGGNEK